MKDLSNLPLASSRTLLRNEISLDEIKTKIDKETLFLFAFVPFVIAEIAWDYADTCVDLASILRISETKRLSRRVRELRQEYERHRSGLDYTHRKIEADNMLAFQEDYKVYFSELYKEIAKQVEQRRPGLPLDSKLLVAGSYTCSVILRALFRYVSIIQSRIADALGIKNIGSIILPQLRQLNAIILQYTGDASISGNTHFPDSLNRYVEQLVEYLLDSEMVELPCKND